MRYPYLSSKNLFRPNEEVYIQKSTSCPEYVDKVHKHDFIEITYIISGECEHIEDETVYYGKAGDLFITNYETPHANKPIQSKEPFIAYDCAFYPGFIDIALSKKSDFRDVASSFLFNSLFPEKNKLSNISLVNDTFYDFEIIFQKLLQEYNEQKNGYYDLIRSYLLELIIKIFRKLQEKNNSSMSKSNNEKYIEIAKKYIETHYMKKIKIEDIAYRLFFSKSSFSRVFKLHTGLCFSSYIQKVRINHACNLLKETTLSISEIAVSVGYNDIKFFYEIFNKLIGMNPGEYRNSTVKT